MKHKAWTLLFLLILILLGQDLWAQCPNCRSAVESGIKSGSTKVGTGLNSGILYLLVLPYALVSVIAYLWYKNYKARKVAGQ